MPIPSARKRRASHSPHGSSPTPLPSDTCAPQRAATTAAFAGAPPLCGTKVSASSKPATGRSHKKSTSDSPRQSTDTPNKISGASPHLSHVASLNAPPRVRTLEVCARCPPRPRAGRRRSRRPSPAAPLHFGIPPLRDLAAHTFRAEFFEDHGFAIWNNTWYGGHYMLSYSVLFPPLAALLSPVWAAAGAAVTSAWLFDRIVRARWGEAGAWAGLWFGVLGAVALLANGWLVFALGVAFGLGALRALQVGRRGTARRARGRQRRSRVPLRPRSSRSCARSACSTRPRRGALIAIVAAALIPLAAARAAVPRERRSSRSGSPRGGRWPCSACLR